MKKIASILFAGLLLGSISCKESTFEENYTDPSKLAETTVEKQFTGFLSTNNAQYVLPGYTPYFTAFRISLNRYNQTVGWPNESGQYIPGSSGVENIWYNYYRLLAQYRELQKVYNAQPAAQQQELKVFMLSASVFLYDQTVKIVDLHGSIPFFEAGMLSTNIGDYTKSNAPYDTPEEIYTFILDDLKSIATQLGGITLNAGYQKSFRTQDFINKGDIPSWIRFANSLRLKMLNRVSGVESFKSRSNSEIAEILGNPAANPIVEENAQNVQINVYDATLDDGLNSRGFQSGLESSGWYGNTAGKKMIDHMNTNSDPRLPVIFEPGANAEGKFIGIDPTAPVADQTALFTGGTVAIYNRFVLSRNQFFPGILINAAEISLIKAEYYLRSSNDALAKAAYNKGIEQSVAFYNGLITISNAIGVSAPAAATDASVTAYIAKDGINWDKATTSDAKLALIADQKWLHYNLVMPYENWADTRRLDLPKFNFWVDNNNNQTTPPFRWTIPTNEPTYNAENYSAVKANDNLKTKIFWDVK